MSARRLKGDLARGWPDAPAPVFTRNVIGSALRRSLRGRGLGAQIRALLDLIADPEPAIARLARRLLTGFKRRSICFSPAPIVSAWAPAPHLAIASPDTSQRAPTRRDHA